MPVFVSCFSLRILDFEEFLFNNNGAHLSSHKSASVDWRREIADLCFEATAEVVQEKVRLKFLTLIGASPKLPGYACCFSVELKT